VARYRLRFLLQEFDLPKGVTILGRSSDCQVTIEDPLVSRHHAQIVLEGDRAVVSDLGSRNGIKINGAPAKQPTELKDGDRLRIGTQELVFCKVEPAAHQSTKTTGFLRHCARCRMPYPQEVGECPNCGETEALEEDTLSGSFGATSQHTWSVQLFVEVLDRALSLNRHEDIQRILRRATITIEEPLHRGDEIDREQLAKLALGALRAAITMHDLTWGLWVVQVYRRVPFMMPEDVAIKLGEIFESFPSDLAEPVEQLALYIATLSAETGDGPARAAFERVHASAQPFIEDTTKPG